MTRFLKTVLFTAIVSLSAAAAQNYAFNGGNMDAQRSAETGFAEQEFRRGVQAYYRGSYNDAILQFEKALSYLPEENLIMDWMGKAYYRAGLEGSALSSWITASKNGYGGLLLQNKIEIIRERRINDNDYDSPVKYTESGSYPGNSGDALIYSQPVCVLPGNDGSMWILSYGSNELLRMDANGLVNFRSKGPFNGFDRPMDLIRLRNGNMLITEFAGDRLTLFSKKGKFIKSFGSKGIGIGNIIGPEYACEDENGNIYVTDFGNCRIDVFDKDGNGLFYFGNSSQGAALLKAPTGIAYSEGIIYVADAVSGAIYKYDNAGNYLGILCREKTFLRPESMKKWGNYLIICDKNKVFSVDLFTGSVFENLNTGNAPSRLTSAVPDVNGNILVTDFKQNEVYVMAKMSELIGGLFVQIERVNADKFPQVTVEVKVENRHRQGVVGLKENNFILTENKGAVLDYKFEGAAYAGDVADLTLILDRKPETLAYAEAMETAVREIARSMNGKGTLKVISSSAIPVIEYSGSPKGCEKFNFKALKNPCVDDCTLDMAIRLAANSMINGEKKKAIIIIGLGSVSVSSFNRYGLNDLTTYLNNNSIILGNVMLNQGESSKEIKYLCKNTDGNEYYVYQSQGLSLVYNDVVDSPSGIYVLSFKSQQKTNFGQKYLPVEVEAYLMKRSGRDESGYFAPLE